MCRCRVGAQHVEKLIPGFAVGYVSQSTKVSGRQAGQAKAEMV